MSIPSRLGNKRRHEDVNHSSDSESCSSNALQVKIDPKTGKPFKYSKKVDRFELVKFIVVESLYNRSFEAALAKYVQIFYKPLEYSEELDRAELVKFICSESILYTTSFMQSLTIYIQTAHYPEYKTIPKSIVRSEILNQFSKYQKELIENFKSLTSKVALAFTITLSTDYLLTIVCVTAHWIDDNYMMQKRVLSYNTGVIDEIEDLINEVVKGYCLDNKLFSISFDNESYNKFVELQLANDPLKPDLDKTLTMKCACHILNEIVRDGMTHFEPEIEKIRKAVRYIKVCDDRATKFEQRCKAHNLMIRCLTFDNPMSLQWNTTYDMLSRAVECKAPLTEMYNPSVAGDEDGNVSGLSDRDWIICEEILDFLNKFYNAVSHFSAGAYYPTSNSTLVYLNDIASLFFRYKDKPFFSDFLPNMKHKFMKCFIPVPPIYLIGALLDPMMKLQHIEKSLKFLYQNLELSYSEQEFESQKQDLLKLANDMYSRYEAAHEQQRQVSMPPPSTSLIRIPRFPGSEFWQQEAATLSNEASSIDQLSLYLQQQHDIDESEFDLLSWWKENRKQFPVLSRMARDVLMVPVSSVELDRAFDQGKMELGEVGGRLAGYRTFEVMECLKDWVKAERRLQGLQEIDAEYLQDFFGWDLNFAKKCNLSDEDKEEEEEEEFEEEDEEFENDDEEFEEDVEEFDE